MKFLYHIDIVDRLLLEHKKSYDNIYIVAVIRTIMMPSCPYFILSTPLSLNMWNIYRFWLSLDDKRGPSLGKLIRPFCIMLLYQYLLHYGLLLHIITQYLCLFSLILQGLHDDGECRNSGLEKE